MLPGTDTATAYIYPGSSLHDELEALVGAGMSNGDAVRAATRRSAEFVGQRDAGEIKRGYRADIVLLRADPLAQIGNIRTVETVVLNGRAFDRPALDQLAQQ